MRNLRDLKTPSQAKTKICEICEICVTKNTKSSKD